MRGKQYRFCPNCGRAHYDDAIHMRHVLSMCCDKQCRDQWEYKYASTLLGHSADPPGNASMETAAAQQLGSAEQELGSLRNKGQGFFNKGDE